VSGAFGRPGGGPIEQGGVTEWPWQIGRQSAIWVEARATKQPWDVGKFYTCDAPVVAGSAKPLTNSLHSSGHGICIDLLRTRRRSLVNVVRLAAYFVFAQCCLAGAAFAGSIVKAPEPATMGLIAVGVGGLAIARKFRGRK
jgi:hypothetical protein